jgi:hypothetical protein
MKKCKGKCQFISRQDFMDKWIVRCVNHEEHKLMHGISKYRKCAVKQLNKTVKTYVKHPEVCC